MSRRINGFVVCISIGEYSDRGEYYFVFPARPDPQKLLEVIKTIHEETKKEMKGENYWKIAREVKDKFFRLFTKVKKLSVVATLRNDAYDKDDDNEWELRTNED